MQLMQSLKNSMLKRILKNPGVWTNCWINCTRPPGVCTKVDLPGMSATCARGRACTRARRLATLHRPAGAEPCPANCARAVGEGWRPEDGDKTGYTGQRPSERRAVGSGHIADSHPLYHVPESTGPRHVAGLTSGGTGNPHCRSIRGILDSRNES